MRSGLLLVAVAALALLVRLGMGVFLGFNSGPDRSACGADTVEFEQMAWSAAQARGLAIYPGGPPSAFRAPGYPMLLAVVYKLFGRAYWVNRVTLSLIGTLTVWLTYLLSRRLGLSEWPSLLAALLASVLPLQFYWCGHFMSEPLAACLNVACTLLVVRAIGTEARGLPAMTSQRRQVGGLFSAGALCGLAALVRAASLLVPVCFALMLMLSRHVRFRRAVAMSAVFGLGAVLAILPWTVRNRIVFDRFALISTNGGSTFWGANNDGVAEPGEKWGSWISTNFDRQRKRREVLSLANEVDRDRKEWQFGREFVLNNPGKMPLLIAGKLWRLLRPFPDSANRIYVLVVGLGWLVLLPISVLGIILALRDESTRFAFMPLNAQLLSLLVTTAVFYGSARFRAPYEPFLAVYAAIGVGWGIGMAASRLRQSTSPRRFTAIP